MQWLVFRKDGATTAGQWAQETAKYASQSGFSAVFDRGKAQRQQAFVKEILRQTMKVWPSEWLRTPWIGGQLWCAARTVLIESARLVWLEVHAAPSDPAVCLLHQSQVPAHLMM